MTVLRVGLAQISASDDPTANADLIADRVAAAAAGGADLVVFPEATMSRFGVPLAPIAQPLDGPCARRVTDIAVAANVHVIAGMFTPGSDGRVRNTLLHVAPSGDRTGYHKIHLFDAFGFAESRTVEPGSNGVIVSVSGVPVGLTTCYDLRFPQLYTELAAAGAQVIVVPASWGDGPGKADAFTTLARARALDSTSFVVAVDQARPTEADPTGAPRGVGNSIAVAPNGAVLAAAGEPPDLIFVDLDTTVVSAVRQALPVLANQRHFSIP